ncbi:hypothetical protein LUZ60_016256 [Juncus effusus]|nr:hypothetical protein LUZ60_016256 [Juncus effusus]
MAETKAHVILFPYPAQGHIIPFLSLADLLLHQEPNLAVTVVSTKRNIKSIRTSLPSDSRLGLHSLPFDPESHGLPAHAESTSDLHFRYLFAFSKANEAHRPAFDEFISTVSSDSVNPIPVCIISDIFLAWTVEVARKHNAFHSIFTTNGAFGGAVEFSLWTHQPQARTDSYSFPLPDHPDVFIDRSQLQKIILSPDGTDPFIEFLRRQTKFCHKTNMILGNTMEEFEPLGLGMLRKTFDMPIQPIGPVLRSPSSYSSEFDTDVMKWMDMQPPKSVLFISFGSQQTLQANQMMELALGLESAGQPFIWAIRPPLGFNPKGEFKPEWLPEGFEERMNQENKGLLVHGWAPQLKILSHKSAGAFLSHCGWNSVLESLANGVPMIGWPLMADQYYNSKMLVEEWGVCVEVARGNMGNSTVDNEKIKEVIETVMGENEKGKEMKKKALEIKDIMKRAWEEQDGSSTKGLEKFFRAIGV